MKNVVLSAAALILALGTGCGGSQKADVPPVPPPEPPAASEPMLGESPARAEVAPEPEKKPEAPPEPVVIEVPIESKSGSKLTGKAQFSEEGDGVKVAIEVNSAKPGQLATHIHEKGDCSAADAASAGSHFNPDKHPHALPTASGPRHLGDLGNITIDKQGKGTLEIVIQGANLKPGDAHSFLDRALIVHEKKDDGGQPTGNAGGRIGCGVIKKS